MIKQFDWFEIEPHLTELAVIMGRDFCHWSDIVTFPVNQRGADELQDLIRVLTQMRTHIEDILAPIDTVVYNANENQKEDRAGSNRKRHLKRYYVKRQRPAKETVRSSDGAG